jgi:hypothetical protein
LSDPPITDRSSRWWPLPGPADRQLLDLVVDLLDKITGIVDVQRIKDAAFRDLIANGRRAALRAPLAGRYAA